MFYTLVKDLLDNPMEEWLLTQLTPEQEVYYQYTCQSGDYIKMCTVPTPHLDASDLAREKKMLEL